MAAAARTGMTNESMLSELDEAALVDVGGGSVFLAISNDGFDGGYNGYDANWGFDNTGAGPLVAPSSGLGPTGRDPDACVDDGAVDGADATLAASSTQNWVCGVAGGAAALLIGPPVAAFSSPAGGTVAALIVNQFVDKVACPAIYDSLSAGEWAARAYDGQGTFDPQRESSSPWTVMGDFAGGGG